MLKGREGLPVITRGSRCLSASAALIAACASLAPAQACDTSPYRIHYHPGSVRLSDYDRSMLEGTMIMAQETSFIRLSGHTDTAGTAEENRQLAKRRVEGARDFLIGMGMPAGRILTESFGESRSITALDDSSPSWRHRYILVELLSPAEARKGRSGRAKMTCGG